MMEELDKNKEETTNDLSHDKDDFILEFIERKKLQNRILQEIIDKLNKSSQDQDLKTNNKKKEP
jgi:hypothetical protein